MTENVGLPLPDAPVRAYFSDEDLIKIRKAVGEAERNTSGEIRVVVGNRFDPDIRNIREQALRDFEDYGLANTKDGSGVLILVLMQQREFTILADRGIHQKMPQPFWEQLASIMQKRFQKNEFVEGISEIVGTVGNWLSIHFPRLADDENELPDDVILKEV